MRQQLAHVLRTSSRSGLVGHSTDPLDQSVLEQAAHGHQHQTHRAVAAHPHFAASAQSGVDHIAVDGVQDDDGIVFHAQGRCGVNPMAIPARRAEFGVDIFGVVAALRGQDDVALGKRLDIVGVLQRRFILRHGRCFAACV